MNELKNDHFRMKNNRAIRKSARRHLNWALAVLNSPDAKTPLRILNLRNLLAAGAGNQDQFLANHGFRESVGYQQRRRTPRAGYGHPEATLRLSGG